MVDSVEYKTANKFKAVLLFLFAREKYLVLAIRHGMAINLEANDLKKRYEEGGYPNDGWEGEAIESARKCASHVARMLFNAFLWILLAIFVTIAVGMYLGTINCMFPFNASKMLTFAGIALASWATLFELGGGIATCSGKALHELIHPVIFQFLFIPGVLMILIGAIL